VPSDTSFTTKMAIDLSVVQCMLLDLLLLLLLLLLL
jgi:hypothetical protein